ncbi:MAG TPA: hypothetical protein PL033_16915 [Candidatus Brocadiia bacterium]|nr:hypothetical protein [Candidatus Brocadiia bacterium]
MNALNWAMTKLFAAIMLPLGLLPPLPALIALSALIGAAFLWAFGKLSDRRKMRAAKDRVKAGLLEIRLFRHDLGAMTRAQFRTMSANLSYMAAMLKPMAIMLLPLALLAAQIEQRFGRLPLEIGETAIISFNLSGALPEDRSEIIAQTSDGLKVDSLLLFIPSSRTVEFRVKATGTGLQRVMLYVRGKPYEKSVVVKGGGDGSIVVAQARRVSGGILTAIAHPCEPTFAGGGDVASASVGYKTASYRILGLNMGWVWIFLAASILSALAFRRTLGVEI